MLLLGNSLTSYLLLLFTKGPDPEGDRHHEPPAPLQTDQPPRRLRGRGRDGAHL